MSEFKQYKRKGSSEMRPYVLNENMTGISVSDPDKALHTLEGGYIARNPKNHEDKWYVAKKYFDDNLELVGETSIFFGNTGIVKNLPYGVALEAAKEGKLIAREGWNGKGMFVFMRPGDEIPMNVIPTIKSLPDSVKNYFSKQLLESPVKFTPYLCMKAADGSIVNGWLASQTDMLCDDWCIL